jgi:hypothetical protein
MVIDSYVSELLEIIDNADDMTRSDLQGVLYAQVDKIIKGSK